MSSLFNFLSFSWKAWQHTNASHDDSDNYDDSNDEGSKASSDGSDFNSKVSTLGQNRRGFGNRNIQRSTSEEDEGEGGEYGGYESIFEYNKASLNYEAFSVPSRFHSSGGIRRGSVQDDDEKENDEAISSRWPAKLSSWCTWETPLASYVGSHGLDHVSSANSYEDPTRHFLLHRESLYPPKTPDRMFPATTLI